MSKTVRGNIIVLVAPSGAGKTTLANKLLEDFENIRFSVSATTRSIRNNEVHGKDYYFLSEDEFQEKIEAGEFLEWEEFYNGIRYGTLKSDVEKMRDNGYYVLLDIEVLGAVNIKKIYGQQALTIFIKPPSLEVLEKRLTDRGTESEQTLKTRLDRAKKELSYENRFDKVVINDDLNHAYSKLKTMISGFMNKN